MVKFPAALITLLCASLAAAQAQDVPIQSQAIRTMMFACDVDKTVAFYRDVLGQKVARDTVVPPSMVPTILDAKVGTKSRYVILEGSGNYPAGVVTGASLSIVEIPNPADPACKPWANTKGRPGRVVMQMRVANIQEIAKRAKAAGAQIIMGPDPSVSKLTWQMLLYDPNGIILELSELNVTPIPDK
jgi:predicted enzyme related to lactoylglutathione lyase